MPEFHVGQDYTRRQISLRLGGSTQNALPHRDNRVVAVCVHANGRNPDAPAVILCGNTPEVSKAGDMLSQQSDPVPVFVFHARHKWEYCGQFRVEATYTEGREFNQWVSRGSRPAPAISRVVILQQVE